MKTASVFHAKSQVASGAQRTGRRTVDLMTRTLHGLMAVSFAVGYVTAESERTMALHIAMGYTLGLLLAVRVVWGCVGPRPVRWGVFNQKLQSVRLLLQPSSSVQSWLMRVQPPVLAGSIVFVLLCMLPVVLSGYASDQDWAGWGGLLGEVHDALANLMLIGVLVHVALVLVLSVLRQKNLALPMLTGRVREQGPDLVRHNYAWAALLLAVGVVAFWWWLGLA